MQENKFTVREFENTPIETVKLLIENGRPITVFAPLIIVSLYYFIYVDSITKIETWINYILLLFGVATLRMGINNVNNVYDVEIDKINKPHRPIPRGDLEKESAFIIGTVFQFISLFVFMLLSLEAFLLDLSFVIVGWLYNIDNGLKNYFPINNLIIGYVRGFGYLLALMIVGEPITQIHLIFAISITLYIFGSINSKDINDVDGDKAMNRQTLPIILGSRNRYLAAISAPFIFSPIFIFGYGVFIGSISSIYLLLMITIPLDIGIVYFIQKASTTKLVENNIAWLFMIITYLSHHIIFSMILIYS
ncbi:MAG: UbiA family prenyltransferase [Candidatus Heimdallarchaeota archaeon]